MNYTPLRYPGGKTKIYKNIKELLPKKELISYAEPFAGGAGAGLKLLINNDIDKFYLNDLDKNIYSFWFSILNYTNKFIKEIEEVRVNLETWHKYKQIIKNSDNYSIFELGFSTFFLNRTNFSGIIKGGAIGGLKQSGKYKIDCRFNKDDLIRKILKIKEHKKRIKLFNLDAINFLEYLNSVKEQVFVYLDPPYYVKGKELYMSFFNDKDHIRIKTAIKELRHPWLLSYDKNVFISDLYKEYKQSLFTVKYTAGKNKSNANELLISI